MLAAFGIRQPSPPDPYADLARLAKGFGVRNVIDGGAYHGRVAGRLAQIFPGAKVFAFEPQEESFRALSWNASSANGAIVPLRLGLSSASGRALLRVNASPATSSLSVRGPLGQRYYPEQTAPVGTQEIELVSLDDWAAGRGVRSVEVLKLDLQGHELEALRGCTRLLRSSVRLVYTEVEFLKLYEGNCLYHELASFLEQHGFELYQLYDLQTGDDGRLLYADALFLRFGSLEPDDSR